MKLDKARFLRNNFRAFMVLFSMCFLFVLTITLFPLIGSLTAEGFPLSRIISENFALLLPLGIGCVILSPLFGYLATRIKRFRHLWLMLTALFGYWLTVILVMLYYTRFNINTGDAAMLFVLGIWTVVAYSVFIIPMLVAAIFWLEWWTRK